MGYCSVWETDPGIPGFGIPNFWTPNFGMKSSGLVIRVTHGGGVSERESGFITLEGDRGRDMTVGGLSGF